MARGFFLPRIGIAAISASRGSGAANLRTYSPREVWADNAVGTAATIDIDLGKVRPIDTMFLGAVRPPAEGATWTITGGETGYADSVLKPAGPLRAPDIATNLPDLTHALWHGDVANVRYLRLSITQPAGSDPLTIGVAMPGYAWRPEFPMEFGGGRRIIDTGTVASLPDGGFATVEGVRKRVFTWTLGDLSEDETDTLEALLLAHGETIPMLVVEDSDKPVIRRNRIHYGLFSGLRAFERRNARQTRWEFAFEEWAAGTSASELIIIPPAIEGGLDFTDPSNSGLLALLTDI